MGDGRRTTADRRVDGDDHVPAPGVLFQMIRDNTDAQAKDHTRIRQDLDLAVSKLDAAVSRLTTLETAHALTTSQLVQLQTAKVDVARVRLPLPLVLSLAGTLVAGFVFLGSLGWGFSAKVDAANKASELAIQSLRSDMAAWRTSSDRESALTARTGDDRSQNIKDTIQRLERQMALQYAEFQSFRQEMNRKR